MSRTKRFRNLAILFLVLIGLVSFAACARGPSAPQLVTGSNVSNENAQPANAPVANDARTIVLDNVSRSQLDQAQAEQQRVVLKTASLAITVDNPTAKLDEINHMAEDMGGWVVNSTANTANTRAGDTLTQASTTIRVPAERLEEARAKIKDGVISIQSDNITGQDVTQDYVDLTSRLTNLRAAETQLQTIMDQARTTDDVLKVYNQLVDIRGQIETAQGQIQYYDQASAFSSIEVTLNPPPTVAQVEVAGWRPLDTAADAFRMLVNVLQAIVNAVIVLVIFVLPLAILIGVPAWFVRRVIRRRTKPLVTETPGGQDDEG
jgi:uncharacterized protein DUF4349